jgi:hypothetical protein
VLKVLQKFPEAVFLVVAMESLLGEEKISSCQTNLRLKSALTFDPTVGSLPNI